MSDLPWGLMLVMPSLIVLGVGFALGLLVGWLLA